MKLMKKYLVFIMIFVLALGLCACSNNAEQQNENSESRTVTDMSGTDVVLPANVDKYAVAWAGITDIVAMYDGVDHLVAYPEKSTSFSMYTNMYPDLKSKICLPDEGISAETVLESGAQVVFLKGSDDESLVNKLRESGIAVIDCEFKDYEGLEKVVNLVADVFGTKEAQDKAAEYCEYLDASVEYVNSKTKNLEEGDRVSAIVIKDTKNYSAYGSTRYTGKWVEMCGANYSMVNEDAYANVNLTQEQILEYNPDFIFFAMPGQADKFLGNSTWKELKAVKEGNVFNIPSGLNTWSNSGAESALIFKWAFAKMYPSLSDNFDAKTVTSYYKTFYNFDISENDIQKTLSSEY